MSNEKQCTCIILDDEKNCVEVLAYEIKKVRPNCQIVNQFTDAELALDFLHDHSADIIFLDIEMPIMNAFQFLDKLSEIPTNIIFTTAYDHYAIKAFRYYAIDYLLKPIERDLLANAIDRAFINHQKLEKKIIKEIHNKIQSPNSVYTKIAVPVESGFRMVTIKDIVRCEASSNYSIIHKLNGDSILISKPLKFLDNLLSSHGFFRTHQSHLINVNYMDSYIKNDGGYITLSNGSAVAISKNKKPLFEAFMTKYMR